MLNIVCQRAIRIPVLTDIIPYSTKSFIISTVQSGYRISFNEYLNTLSLYRISWSCNGGLYCCLTPMRSEQISLCKVGYKCLIVAQMMVWCHSCNNSSCIIVIAFCESTRSTVSYQLVQSWNTAPVVFFTYSMIVSLTNIYDTL